MNSKHQLTKEGFEQIAAKLQKLKDEDRPRVIEALKEARAQGDLSENAEYDAARDEQARIENEIKELEEIIKSAVIIEESTGANNVGKTITVKYLDDEELETFNLVSSSLEADPFNGKISKEAPLGRAVLEAKAGDEKTVKTESGFEFKVLVMEIK